MTPTEYLQHCILVRAIINGDLDADLDTSSKTIADLYEKFSEEDLHYDYEANLREGQVETKLPTEYSRHYESKSVAAKMSDGTWVGWTYWYGGGKHGEPEAIDWMEDAYFLSCVEEDKLVTIQTFAKI